MRTLAFVPLLLASGAWAEQPADRVAIEHAIAAQLFTADASVDRLPEIPSARPTVVISHEPWGEARINFPSLDAPRPKFTSGSIRFITPDVAVAEGALTYLDESGSIQSTPVFFVLKKAGVDWKIAALRVLARQAAPKASP